MRKVMSIVASGIVVLAILFLFLPFLTGILIQKKYPDLLAQFSSATGANIQMQSYHRGWFKSEATLQIIMPSSLPMTIDQKIMHGPIAYAHTQSGSKLFFALAAIKNTVQSQHTQLYSISIWKWNNTYTFTTQSDQFIAQTPIGELSLSQFNSAVNFSLITHHLVGKLDLQQLQLKPNNATQPTMHVQIFQFDSNIKNNHGLENGDIKMNLGDFSLIALNNPATEMQDANFFFQQNQTNEITSMHTVLNVEHLNTADEHLSHVHFDLALNNLNTQALKQYWQQMVITHSAITQLYSLFQIANQGLVIELNAANATTPDGLIQIQGSIQCPSDAARKPEITSLLLQITGHANISLPYQFVLKQWIARYGKADAAQALADRIKSGEFIQQGNQLSMTIELKNAALLVNGKPISAYSTTGQS